MISFLTRPTLLGTLLFALARPGYSHEFWIEPRAYEIPEASEIEADLRVGTNFAGPGYPFIPQGYERARFVTPHDARDLEFTGQDDPALTLMTSGSGLHTIVLTSRFRTILHDGFDAFEEFAEEVGRGSEVSDARRTGQVREAYFRHAKALIGVGDGAGEDEFHGALYEWVALDNPYLAPGGSLRFLLQFDGQPAPDEPAQIFARDLNDGGDVRPIHMKTDANGVLTLPTNISGEILLNSVKILKAPARSEISWISHWASMTFLH